MLFRSPSWRSPYVTVLSPQRMAALAPRPAATLASTRIAAALNRSGIPSTDMRTPFGRRNRPNPTPWRPAGQGAFCYSMSTAGAQAEPFLEGGTATPCWVTVRGTGNARSRKAAWPCRPRSKRATHPAADALSGCHAFAVLRKHGRHASKTHALATARKHGTPQLRRDGPLVRDI